MKKSVKLPIASSNKSEVCIVDLTLFLEVCSKIYQINYQTAIPNY